MVATSEHVAPLPPATPAPAYARCRNRFVELSLEATLSAGRWLGHLSYFLLVLSMLMRRIVWLRAFAITSALTGIVYDAVWLHDPVGVFWESLLLAANVGQLTLMHWEDRRARFTEEERDLAAHILPGLPNRQRRKLLDLGTWVWGEPGTVLAREGESVAHLVYLAFGKVSVSVGGVHVGVCRPGAFVGEITALSGGAATGRAVVTEPSRYWAVDARVLRQLCAKEPEIRRALQSAFSRSVRDKLERTNETLVRERSGPSSSSERPD